MRYHFCGLAAWCALSSLVAQAQTPDPVYAKVNAAIGYQVDPSWPKRPATVAPLGSVSGLAVDKEDRVWIFNRGEDCVQVYGADGEFLRTWGRGKIKAAHHLKIDPAGNIWLTDNDRHVVERFTPAGERTLMLGVDGEYGHDEKHFYYPTDVAVAPSGDIFVADGYGNARVVHFDKQGQFVKSWGRAGSKPGEFSLVHAIAIDKDNRLYVADRNNVRVQVFDVDGKLLDVWNNLITPWGLFVTRQNEIWVCGSSPMRWWTPGQYAKPLGVPPKDQLLMRFRPDGRATQIWSVPKSIDGQERPGELNWVHCIAEDSHGSIYVGDIIGKRAQKFTRLEIDP